MSRTYVNGCKALPPELLAEVQKHVSGLVWIPSGDGFYRRRRELIFTLREQGAPTREIARLAAISIRRVNQILAREGAQEGAREKREAQTKLTSEFASMQIASPAPAGSRAMQDS